MAGVTKNLIKVLSKKSSVGLAVRRQPATQATALEPAVRSPPDGGGSAGKPHRTGEWINPGGKRKQPKQIHTHTYLRPPLHPPIHPSIRTYEDV